MLGAGIGMPGAGGMSGAGIEAGADLGVAMLGLGRYSRVTSRRPSGLSRGSARGPG